MREDLKMSELIQKIESIAKIAGQEAMLYYNHIRQNTVMTKNTPKDLVSTADKMVEKLIFQNIKANFPGHSILGEEFGLSRIEDAKYCWVVDPIDGTQSFIRNQPFFSISIALKKEGETIAGCVFAPRLDMMFSAELNQGAYENGKPIHVSDCENLSLASGATGFACLRAGLTENNNLPICMKLFPVLRDIKRCGSAALDLCFVASGRFDVFWELMLQEYDVAAGALIAKEAGAVVSDFLDGDKFPERGIVCSNSTLHKQMLPYLNIIRI